MQVFVAAQPEGCWAPEVSPVAPGSELALMVMYRNTGDDTDDDVIVGLNLPDGVTLVPNETTLYNTNHPDGIDLETNNVGSGGVNIGGYARVRRPT